MRIAFLFLVLGTIPVTGVKARSPVSQPVRTVPCVESIDITKFPYVGSRDPRHRYRQVLGAVSVPPRYLQQIVRTRSRPWRYWRKAGLVVRAGAAVKIDVPAQWRGRAAIAWGYGGHGAFNSLRIARCGGEAGTGHAYSGGFYLRSPSACLPLIFRVGRSSATVRFGLGRRCGSS